MFMLIIGFHRQLTEIIDSTVQNTNLNWVSSVLQVFMSVHGAFGRSWLCELHWKECRQYQSNSSNRKGVVWVNNSKVNFSRLGFFYCEIISDVSF